jgi:hypothetical protein
MATHESRPSEPPESAPSEGESSGQSSSRRSAILTRLLVWLIFGVVFGGLPFIAGGVIETFSPGGFSLNDLLGEGGLFIISAVMAAGALGELFVAVLPERERNYQVAAGGSCLLLCVGNTAAYVASTTSAACLEAERRAVGMSSAPLKFVIESARAQQQACIDSAAFVHPTLALHLSVWFFVITALSSAACIGMAAGR